MLGEKVETKNGLDFYVFPQEELTYTKDQRSINIMVIGEKGVGKSTWLHCFLNYLQGMQIEEKKDIIYSMKKNFKKNIIELIKNKSHLVLV